MGRTGDPNLWDCADDTCGVHFILALANQQCQMHYEIRSQEASSSDPPTTGSSGDPGGYRRQIAGQLRGSACGDASRPAKPAT
jgi:hypothetical protein